MAKVVSSSVLEFSVKGGEIHVKALKRNADATKKYAKTLKDTRKESSLAVRNFRNLDDSSNSLGGTFSVLRSKLLLASFAFGMVARTAGKYIKVAADAEEITNKFNVVFGESAKSADKFASVLGEATGRSSTKLKEMLSALQDTFVPLGFARDTSAKLSKALSQLSLDVASFNNKADDEVMKAFQSAIVGNHEAVRSFGIVLTEASVKEEALRTGIIKSNRELTAQEKVLSRVSLIYKSTKDAQGDLIRTQDSYTNQLKAFNDQMFELQRTIGETLMPIAANLLSLGARFADTAHIKAFALVLGTVVTVMGTLTIAAKGATWQMLLLNKAMKRNLIMIGLMVAVDMISWFFKAKKGSDELGESVEDTTETLKNLGDVLKTNESEISRDAYLGYIDDFRELHESAQLSRETIEELQRVQKELNAEYDKGDQFLIDSTNAIKERISSERENIVVAEAGAVTASKAADAVYELIKPTKEYNAWLKANTEAEKARHEKVSESFEAQFEARLSFNEKLKTLQTSETERQKNFLAAELLEYEALGIGKIELAEYEKERLKEINQEAHDEEIALIEEKRQVYSEALGEIGSYYGNLASATKKQADATMQNEINALRQTENWRVATTEQREVLEEDIRAKHGKRQAQAFNYEKNASILTATINAYEAITKTLASVPYPFNYAAAAAIGGLAFQQVTAIAGTPAPSFAMGGLIEGSSHSAGGVMINAEGGEFVMNKGAVDSIGTDALDSMNQGGAGVVINITGNVMTDDFTRDKIIPEIQQAIRLNLA